MSPESTILVDQHGTVIDPVGGFENEYAAVATVHGAENKWRISPGGLLYLGYEYDGITTNCFGEDGSRRYLDVGEHPEYSTAEDDIFLMAAYRALWGHQATADDLRRGAEVYVNDEFHAASSIDLQLYANTTDFKGNAWGRHNNTLAPRALMPSDYIPAFIAHRASRIVWSGAGYVRSPNGNPNNVQRCLSERAEFIYRDVGYEDLKNRALVHMRDEPLCDGDLYRRIHDTAGEGVFAPNVNALILATEALIARACGRGIKYDDLQPINGPQAIKQISRDITLRKEIEVGERGVHYTGIQLQTEVAERTLGGLSTDGLMTEQDRIYETMWIDYLDKLKNGQFTTGDNNEMYLFDWVPKLEQIDIALQRPNKKLTAILIAQVLARNYHQILPKYGKGMQLVMEGRFPNSPDVAIIQNGPPLPDTRAKPRGEAIRRLRRKGRGYDVDWYHLRVEDTDRTVILKDPFASEDNRVEEILQSVAA